jgi:glycosyltransferase involved in cell wall biosynthesis
MNQYKFSIITPEHNPNNAPFLLELYKSIANQTYSNWEWILYLNNGCSPDDLPELILMDDRVMIYHCLDAAHNIGAIKNAAFNLGTGDVLVEADHDDILTPDCLEELNIAFQDQQVGFVFSDNAVLHMKDEFSPFSSTYGWTHRMFEWQGKQLYAMNSFEPSSHSVGYIWYAPDHVRSWRTSIYKEIGGHNPDLSVCDDHELMIRTYLTTNMKRIPKVLYIYRITGDNTWLARNQEIQTKTVELFNQYAMKLAERDAEKRNLLKVDIGGGINSLPGYITLDQRETAHVVCDLNNGIPLPDNSVGVLNASHIIEHLRDPIKTMREIHRVLAHGGWAFIEVPSTDGRGAFQDPTHVSYWNENSFLYYTNSYFANFIENKDIRFQEFRRETWFPNEFLRNMNVCVTTAWLVAHKPNGNTLPHGMYI